MDSQTKNLALLSKWVTMIMSSMKDLALKLLRDSYGAQQDWRCMWPGLEEHLFLGNA